VFLLAENQSVYVALDPQPTCHVAWTDVGLGQHRARGELVTALHGERAVTVLAWSGLRRLWFCWMVTVPLLG
jgi:hypothetical protein